MDRPSWTEQVEPRRERQRSGEGRKPRVIRPPDVYTRAPTAVGDLGPGLYLFLVLQSEFRTALDHTLACTCPLLFGHVSGRVPVVHALRQVYSDELAKLTGGFRAVRFGPNVGGWRYRRRLGRRHASRGGLRRRHAASGDQRERRQEKQHAHGDNRTLVGRFACRDHHPPNTHHQSGQLPKIDADNPLSRRARQPLGQRRPNPIPPSGRINRYGRQLVGACTIARP